MVAYQQCLDYTNKKIIVSRLKETGAINSGHIIQESLQLHSHLLLYT